jgi:NADPH-dependent 2,4-dienoyl-CoA reductase/sulfur reductase-like enzyme
MDHIHKSLATAAQGETVAIIGGGYIGLELADVLTKRGFKVEVVEFLKQVLSVFDPEMTTPIEKELKTLGVTVHLGDSAEKISQSADKENTLILSTKNGLNIEAHSVIMSIGVKPASELAAAAGLKIGAMGGIVVDEYMKTEDPAIYAVGDVVEVTDFVTSQHVQIPLAGPAARQARIAADNICGRKSTFRGTQGTAVLGVGKLVAGMTGATEKALQRANIKYQKIYIHPNQHVAYYPGAKTLSAKLLFAPDDGKILGMQVVGEEGVDKITDTIAMAIQGRMTVFDLEEAELAYAPQYGAAKSVVNMLGFVAAGVLRGDQRHVQLEDLAQMADKTFILDVRNPPELIQQGTIPNGVNIPLPMLRDSLDKVPKDKTIVTVCRVGQRAYST